jgi:hypothetical protein
MKIKINIHKILIQLYENIAICYTSFHFIIQKYNKLYIILILLYKIYINVNKLYKLYIISNLSIYRICIFLLCQKGRRNKKNRISKKNPGSLSGICAKSFSAKLAEAEISRKVLGFFFLRKINFFFFLFTQIKNIQILYILKFDIIYNLLTFIYILYNNIYTIPRFARINSFYICFI